MCRQHKAASDAIKSSTQRPPSSEDSTSGYFSSRASCTEDQPGLVVSLQLRKPEILLASEPAAADDGPSHGHGHGPGPSNCLLLRTELTLDYNRHSYRETLICSLASLRVSHLHLV